MLLTNKYNLPETLFDAIENDGYDVDQSDLSIISTTTLINPPKIRILRSRHWDKVEEDVSENIWRLLGTSVHAILERVSSKNRLLEERITIEFDGKKVSGKTDIYVDEKVEDYKVTSAWTIVYNPDGKKDWENQLNVNAWLFRKQGFEVKELNIIAILRDWSKTKAKSDPNYPQLPVVVVNIPLWSMEQQEAYIKTRVMVHKMHETAADDEIPCCTPEERWSDPDKFAVYKNGNKTATKVCGSKDEADEYIANADSKHAWRIEERKGGDRRCPDYCAVNKFCHYYKNNY